MSEQFKELSEPLNPSGDKYELTPKQLTEWILCTECYPKEKVYKTKTSDLTSEEQNQRKEEIAQAMKQPANAMLQLDKWGGEKGLIEKLHTHKERGLTSKQVEISRAYYGNNAPLERKTKTICDMIMENLGDYFIILLLIAAGVELVLGVWQEGWKHGWVDGVSIFLAVIIITTVNVVNSYKTEQTFAKLLASQDDKMVEVIRDGATPSIHVNEVVVGDILICPQQKKLNADGIIIVSNDMKCNESDLTGEKDDLDKKPYKQIAGQPFGKPFVFKGCQVTQGKGTMLVTCVGLQTNEGSMQKQMDFEDEQTPLQNKLNTIVEWIGKIGIISAALVFLALVLRIVFDIWAFGQRDLSDEQNLTDVTQAFIVAVTVVVMAVPEGLPLAVTISLQFSISDLQNTYNALVRKPDATEVMGGCNEICSDKTGTLTANKMTVMACWVEQGFYDEYDAAKEGIGKQHGVVAQLGSMKDVADAILINSADTKYTEVEDEKTKEKSMQITGNATEIGIFNYLKDCGYDISNEHAADLASKRIFITPFDSKKKYATVAYRREDGSVRVVVKGAPDFVSKICTRIERSHGNVEPCSEEEIARLMGDGVIKKFASKSYRTILAAYKDFSAEDWELFAANNDVDSDIDAIKFEARKQTENNLIISAIFGIEDPLRECIPETIRQLKRAGVRTRMCTGDNVETARSICEKAGIIVDPKDETDPEIIEKLRDPLFLENRKKYECMLGEDFRKEFGRKNEEKDIWEANNRTFHWRNMIIPHLKCLARSSPTDKQILVQGIQQYSEPKAIVAVTGDGTNDCPALKMADVGFAMNDGSDAAKQESKVILLTNDFNSTLICVKFGRNIYDSVQKFLQFQLTVNVVAIFIVLLGAVVLNEKVLTSVQILWVNLIMDTFAALALATEPATDELLEREPTKREESIVSNVMARNIVGWSIYQIGALCFVLFAGTEMFDLEFRVDDPFFWTKQEIDENDGSICSITDFGTITDENPIGDCGVIGEPSQKVILYTMVFNMFVWLQVFNQFNARKIKDKEYNVFSGLMKNCWFIAIAMITIVVQILVVFFGGRPLRTTPLTLDQQLFTIGVSAGIIPWHLICQALLKAEWFGWASDCVPNEEATDETIAESGVIAISGRASARVKNSMRDSMKKKIVGMVDAEKKKNDFSINN